MDTAYDDLMKLTDGHGYDDVFVYTPIRAVAELGNKLLAFDGCMNFFSGPTDKNFSADINLYDCHYTSTHIMGTTGGNNDDLIEANTLAAKGIIDPAVMITHVGGIDSIAETTLNLPKIPGGKKLAYTQFDMPMTAIEDFAKLGENGVNIRMITQGPEELNIIVGVEEKDFEQAIRVLYNSFVKENVV